MNKFKEQHRQLQQQIARDEHRIKLEHKYDLTTNPKALILYEKAWELGHSSGFSEVESYYMDLMELIR